LKHKADCLEGHVSTLSTKLKMFSVYAEKLLYRDVAFGM